MTCYGRFYDRFVRHDGRWRIGKRVPIYEKYPLHSVDAASGARVDPAELARYPDGYRHLAYLQARGEARITPGLPTPNSEALAALCAYAAA